MFNGHGNSASVSIGTGIQAGNDSSFSKLKPLFARSKFHLGIEFHSCCFASAVSVRPRDKGAIAEWLIERWGMCEPERGMRRFYRFALQPNLFGAALSFANVAALLLMIRKY